MALCAGTSESLGAEQAILTVPVLGPEGPRGAPSEAMGQNPLQVSPPLASGLPGLWTAVASLCPHVELPVHVLVSRFPLPMVTVDRGLPDDLI